MAEHLITRDAPTHRRWEVDQEPVVRIQPGDVVTAETDDFAGGQITRDSTAADLPKLDFDLIYPLAGPIHVEGAEPGDAVAVEFLEFELPEWGWACIIPGFGLLPPGEFTDPYIKFFDLTGGDDPPVGRITLGGDTAAPLPAPQRIHADAQRSRGITDG